jgi:PAS domain S-box-containing protein
MVNNRKNKHHRTRITIFLIAVLGIICSIAGFFLVDKNEKFHVQLEFERLAEPVVYSLQHTLEDVLNDLDSIVRFFDNSNQVTRREFSKFTTSMLSKKDEIQALEWIPYVKHSERKEYEAEAEKDGFTDFYFTEKKEGKIQQESKRSAYYPVYFLEPLKGNEAALGYDLGSNSIRLEALNNSRDSGFPTATARIRLIQETEEQYGFLVFCPIYHKDKPVSTIEERRQNLEGFVLGVFRIGKLVDSVLKRHNIEKLSVKVLDLSAPEKDQILIDTVDPDSKTISFVTRTFKFAGRNWSVTCLLTDKNVSFIYSHFNPSLLVLLLGLLVTFIVVYMISVFVRKEENKSFDNQERSAATLKSIGDGVISTDISGNVSNMNSVAEKLSEWNLKEALNKPIEKVFNIVSLKTNKTIKSPVRTVIDTREKTDLPEHTALINRNGRKIPISDSAAPIYGHDKKLIGVVLVFRDVSEEYKMQENLKSSLKHLKKRTFDLGERVKELNYLYTISELIQQRNIPLEERLQMIVDLIPPAWQYPDITCAKLIVNNKTYKTAGYKDTMWSLTSDITIKDKKVGKFIVAYTEKKQDIFEGPFLKEERSLINTISKVITGFIERVNAENELKRSNKELENFAYIASHDLKSPLRAIDNLASWIKEDLEDIMNNETKEHLDLLRSRIDRMENLLNSLLEYSRVGRDDSEADTVDLNVLLNDIISMISPPKESVTVNVQKDLPVFITYKAALQQVFMNLIGNAIKHRGNKNININISFEDLGLFYKFIIKDNGPGIPKELHEKAFQLFQTLRPRDEVEGSGMGLAIVKKAIENNGGLIKLNSEKDSGAEFTFTWPKKIT